MSCAGTASVNENTQTKRKHAPRKRWANLACSVPTLKADNARAFSIGLGRSL
jgi:hypothetical protein